MFIINVFPTGYFSGEDVIHSVVPNAFLSLRLLDVRWMILMLLVFYIGMVVPMSKYMYAVNRTYVYASKQPLIFENSLRQRQTQNQLHMYQK